MEKDLVDFTLSVDASDWFFKISDVPEVQHFVLSSGGQIFGIWGDCDGVDLSIVWFEGVSDLEVGVPDLQLSIPGD